MNDEPEEGPALTWARKMVIQSRMPQDEHAKSEATKAHRFAKEFFSELVAGTRPHADATTFWGDFSGHFGEGLARESVMAAMRWGRPGRPPAAHTGASYTMQAAMGTRGRGNPTGNAHYTKDQLQARNHAWLLADRVLEANGMPELERSRYIYEHMYGDVEWNEMRRLLRKLRKANNLSLSLEDEAAIDAATFAANDFDFDE